MHPAQFKVKCKKAEEYKPYYPKDREDKHEKEYKVRLQCSKRLFLRSPCSAAGHAWLCDLRSSCVSTA
jgi:hypothetical protein